MCSAEQVEWITTTGSSMAGLKVSVLVSAVYGYEHPAEQRREQRSTQTEMYRHCWYRHRTTERLQLISVPPYITASDALIDSSTKRSLQWLHWSSHSRHTCRPRPDSSDSRVGSEDSNEESIKYLLIDFNNVRLLVGCEPLTDSALHNSELTKR